MSRFFSCLLNLLRGSDIFYLSREFSFSCEFQGISSDLAEDYCWIHGSYIIPPEYQPHLRCIVDQVNFMLIRFFVYKNDILYLTLGNTYISN